MILGVDIGNIKTIDESKSNSTTKILDELKKKKISNKDMSTLIRSFKF